MDYLRKYPDLEILFDRNSLRSQEKITQNLEKLPSQTDGEGFVYGFFSPSDKNLRRNFWMKLGRTTRFNPEERVAQWGGNLIFCQRSHFNKRFERLVHLFFDFAHKIRYNDGKKEVEWFHFEERINISKYVSMICELIDDCFLPGESYFCELETEEDSNYDNPDETATEAEKVNINTATLNELMRLPDINKGKAKRIIDYRENYPFRRVEDISRVSYIGTKTYNSIINLIEV